MVFLESYNISTFKLKTESVTGEMVMSELNFSDDFELYVDVYIDDLPTVKGLLVFRSNRAPYLSIEDNQWYSSFKTDSEEFKKIKSRVKCTCKGDVYFLYLNNVHFNALYPKYILKSKGEYSYSRFYISIPEVYQFFNGASGFRTLDGELRKKIKDYFLKVEFNYKDEKYLLTVEHYFSVSTDRNMTKIFEDAVLCVERLNGEITFDDAKKLSFKILTFFSLIFGTDLSIKYISLGSDDNGGVYSPFYFISRYFDNNIITYPAKTLITHPSYITMDDWSVMLNNFFSAQNMHEFEDIWTRFVSMYSYKGFWEYEVLGYASILDAYSQKLIDKEKKYKIPSPKMKKLKVDLISLIHEKAKLLDTDNQEECNEIIESLCCYVDGFKNTLNPTFKERYLYVLNLIDSDFLSVINFTDKDFVIIKKIRDEAAHGKPVKMHTETGNGLLNLSNVFVLLSKLVVLLSCLAFKKLGINEKSFAKLIAHSHNENIINASLDELKLDMFTEQARLVNVDVDTFSIAKKSFSFDFVVLENKETNDLIFNDSQLLGIMVDYKTINEGTFITDDFCYYVYNNYSLDAYYCVEFVSKVYCVFNDKNTSIHNVLWVTFK